MVVVSILLNCVHSRQHAAALCDVARRRCYSPLYFFHSPSDSSKLYISPSTRAGQYYSADPEKEEPRRRAGQPVVSRRTGSLCR